MIPFQLRAIRDSLSGARSQRVQQLGQQQVFKEPQRRVDARDDYARRLFALYKRVRARNKCRRRLLRRRRSRRKVVCCARNELPVSRRPTHSVRENGKSGAHLSASRAQLACKQTLASTCRPATCNSVSERRASERASKRRSGLFWPNCVARKSAAAAQIAAAAAPLTCLRAAPTTISAASRQARNFSHLFKRSARNDIGCGRRFACASRVRYICAGASAAAAEPAQPVRRRRR